MVTDINWVGVFLASVAAFASGFAWFNEKTFFGVWWRLMGKGDEQPGGNNSMALVFASLVLGIVVQAVVIELILDSVRGNGELSGISGAGWGIAIGLLIAAASLGHRLFAGHGYRVWLIEVANDVLNCVIAGAILGALN